MKSTGKKLFGQSLTAWRKRSGLTFRGLAETAGMKHSYLAAVQGGRRGVGAGIAERLADAIGLKGVERIEFLRLAVATRAATTSTEKADSLRLLLGEWVLSQVHHEDLHPSNLMVLCNSCHKKLWTASVGDAKAGRVSPQVLEEIDSRPDHSLWLLLFMPAGKQALVECIVKVFEDEQTSKDK